MQMCFICIFCIVEVEYYKNGKFVLPIYKVKRGKFDWSDDLKKGISCGRCLFSCYCFINLVVFEPERMMYAPGVRWATDRVGVVVVRSNCPCSV